MNDSDSTDSFAAKRLFHPIDVIVAIVLLAFCAWLYYLTTQFESVSDLFAQDITPEFFPQLLLIVIVAMTLLLPIEHKLFGNGKQLDKGRSDSIGPMTYLTVVLLLSILLILPWLGVYLAMVVVCLLLPLLWGERRLIRIMLFAVIFPLLVALLFTQVLSVYFIPGVFNLSFR